jgi:hypothetical protein
MFPTLRFRLIRCLLLLVGLLASMAPRSGQAAPAQVGPTAAPLTLAGFRATVRRL